MVRVTGHLGELMFISLALKVSNANSTKHTGSKRDDHPIALIANRCLEETILTLNAIDMFGRRAKRTGFERAATFAAHFVRPFPE